MAEAGEEIDVGGPRADAVHGGKHSVGGVGGKLGEARELKLAALDGAGDRLEGTDLGRGEAEPRQASRPGAQDGLRLERVERRFEASPDRVGARGRQLLRHDDGGKPREAVRPPSQRRPPCRGQDCDEPWIGQAQRRKAGVEIGIGMNVGLHFVGLGVSGSGRGLSAVAMRRWAMG